MYNQNQGLDNPKFNASGSSKLPVYLVGALVILCMLWGLTLLFLQWWQQSSDSEVLSVPMEVNLWCNVGDSIKSLPVNLGKCLNELAGLASANELIDANYKLERQAIVEAKDKELAQAKSVYDSHKAMWGKYYLNTKKADWVRAQVSKICTTIISNDMRDELQASEADFCTALTLWVERPRVQPAITAEKIQEEQVLNQPSQVLIPAPTNSVEGAGL